MCEDSGEQVGLVGNEAVEGDVSHICVGFEFCEDTFLRTASVVKVNNLRCGGSLVGENDLMGIAKLLGDEKVELNRLLGLHRLASTNKQEPACKFPGFGFPEFFEECDVRAAGGPTLS